MGPAFGSPWASLPVLLVNKGVEQRVLTLTPGEWGAMTTPAAGTCTWAPGAPRHTAEVTAVCGPEPETKTQPGSVQGDTSMLCLT